MLFESIFTFSPPRLWPVIHPVNVDFNALTDCANCIQSQTDTNCIDIQYPSKVTQTFNARLHSTPLVHSTLHLLFLTFTTILVLLTSRTYVPFFCYKTTDGKQDDIPLVLSWCHITCQPPQIWHPCTPHPSTRSTTTNSCSSPCRWAHRTQHIQIWAE